MVRKKIEQYQKGDNQMSRYEKSIAAFKEAKELFPGGVNSPVRAFKSVNMNPIFMESGQGATMRDIDGNTYIDYVLSWGPLILGHCNEKVVEGITRVAKLGTSFGTPSLTESELAKLVMERMPAVEMVRMVSSGTEAVISALRLARGYTKRSKIVKFEGNYHGHGDSLLIKAGSGVATLGLPDSPGVPTAVAQDTLTVPYNHLDAVKELFAAYPNEIAAVILEPIGGNMGLVLPKEGFLQGVRELTAQNGALLIFDEVMTGFRCAYGSAQTHFGVMPDLVTMGKVIGGGLPVGAYGGKREIMEHVAPNGPVYQAGTLSGNPLAMVAGYETLSQLTEESYAYLNKIGARLENGLHEAAEAYGIAHKIYRCGGMFGFLFTDTEVVDYETAKTADTERFAKYFKGMVDGGIYLPPSQFEAMFLSVAHTEEQIDQTIAVAKKVFATL